MRAAAPRSERVRRRGPVARSLCGAALFLVWLVGLLGGGSAPAAAHGGEHHASRHAAQSHHAAPPRRSAAPERGRGAVLCPVRRAGPAQRATLADAPPGGEGGHRHAAAVSCGAPILISTDVDEVADECGRAGVAPAGDFAIRSASPRRPSKPPRRTG